MKAKFSKAIEALNFTNDENKYYYNLDNDKIFMSMLRISKI